jgi:16S rRNA C967 or C1407 C5-methylase (RsmB/RsmF family)
MCADREEQATPDVLAAHLRLAEQYALTPGLDDGSKPSVLNTLSHAIDPNLELAAINAWFRSPAPVFAIPFQHKIAAWQQFLKAHSLSFEVQEDIYAFPSHVSLNEATEHGICRIQDYGSYLAVKGLELPKGSHVWDCCSGAGGKALSLIETYPGIQLTCSDIRPQILENLKVRFQQAGLLTPRLEVLNLENRTPSEAIGTFDCIIADVPCAGSGTWRRNPEVPHFFDTGSIEKQAVRQASIIGNALSRLKSGGILVYITCSIFESENQRQLGNLIEKHNLTLLSSGYTTNPAQQRSDYIFRAVLKKD